MVQVFAQITLPGCEGHPLLDESPLASSELLSATPGSQSVRRKDVKTISENDALSRPFLGMYYHCAAKGDSSRVIVCAGVSRDRYFLPLTVMHSLKLNHLNTEHKAMWVPAYRSLGQKPVARYSATLTADDKSNFYLIGGSKPDDTLCSTLFVYNASKNQWKIPSVTPKPRSGRGSADFIGPRCSHVAVFQPRSPSAGRTDRGRVIVHGGFDSHEEGSIPRSDIHVFDIYARKWSIVKQNPKWRTPAPALAEHAGVLLDNRWFVLYGGRDEEQIPQSDVFVFDLERRQWVKPRIEPGGVKPEGRFGHAMTPSVTSEERKLECVIYGGAVRSTGDGDDFSNEMFSLTLKVDEYLSTKGGEPRVVFERKKVVRAYVKEGCTSGVKPDAVGEVPGMAFGVMIPWEEEKAYLVIGGIGDGGEIVKPYILKLLDSETKGRIEANDTPVALKQEAIQIESVLEERSVDKRSSLKSEKGHERQLSGHTLVSAPCLSAREDGLPLLAEAHAISKRREKEVKVSSGHVHGSEAKEASLGLELPSIPSPHQTKISPQVNESGDGRVLRVVDLSKGECPNKDEVLAALLKKRTERPGETLAQREFQAKPRSKRPKLDASQCEDSVNARYSRTEKHQGSRHTLATNLDCRINFVDSSDDEGNPMQESGGSSMLLDPKRKSRLAKEAEAIVKQAKLLKRAENRKRAKQDQQQRPSRGKSAGRGRGRGLDQGAKDRELVAEPRVSAGLAKGTKGSSKAGVRENDDRDDDEVLSRSDYEHLLDNLSETENSLKESKDALRKEREEKRALQLDLEKYREENRDLRLRLDKKAPSANDEAKLHVWEQEGRNKAEISQLRAQISHLKDIKDGVSEELQEARDCLTETNYHALQKDIELKNLSFEIGKLKGKLKKSNDLLKQETKALRQAEREKSTAVEMANEATEQKDKERIRLITEKQKGESLQRQVSELVEGKTKRERELQIYRISEAKSAGRVKQLAEQAQKLQRLNKELTNEKEKLQGELDRCMSQIRGMQERAMDIETVKQDLNYERSHAEDDRQKLESRAARAERSLAQAQNEMVLMSQKLSAASLEASRYKREREKLERQAAGNYEAVKNISERYETRLRQNMESLSKTSADIRDFLLQCQIPSQQENGALPQNNATVPSTSEKSKCAGLGTRKGSLAKGETLARNDERLPMPSKVTESITNLPVPELEAGGVPVGICPESGDPCDNPGLKEIVNGLIDSVCDRKNPVDHSADVGSNQR